MIPVAFQAPIDIMNRALQRVGASRIASVTEDSKNCDEVTFCYDKLRVAELRRNVWRFAIRTAAIRPLTNYMAATSAQPEVQATMAVTPAVFSLTKNYIPGSLVSYNTKVYFSKTNTTGEAPDITPTSWSQYFGPLVANFYDSTASYYPGELVYTPAVNGTVKVYMALVSTSAGPTTVPDWDATITYNKDDTVTYSSTVYQSTTDLNINNIPAGIAPWLVIAGTQPDNRQGSDWLKLDASVSSMSFVYPVGAGPWSQSSTKNVYMLPNGFLREAPQDPKAGINTFLGGPTGNAYSDWVMQDKFIITSCSGVIILRFCADIADVTLMDSMFCEGLACRIGVEVCETLTQSSAKVQVCGTMYKEFMGSARVVNGIETGATEPPEDDFITVRQ